MKTKILTTVLLMVASGCSLKPGAEKSTATMTIDIPQQNKSAVRDDLSGTFSPLDMNLMSANVAPPPTLGGFQCLAINVLGPGIPRSDNSNDSRDPGAIFQQLIAGNSYCSYRGIASPPIKFAAGTQSVDLQVPVGPTRLVQAVGVMDPNNTVCSSPGMIDGGGNNIAQFYEIARATVDVNTDISIGLNSNYDTMTPADRASRLMNCGGNSSTGPSCVNVIAQDTGGTSDYMSSSMDQLAQTFTPAATTIVNDVMLVLSTAGSAETVTLKIFPDSSAQPGGTPVAVSNPVTIAAATGATPFQFVFPTPPSLTGGNVYWLVPVRSGFNQVNWTGSSSDVYSGGAAYKKVSSTFATSSVGDFAFDIHQCQ